MKKVKAEVVLENMYHFDFGQYSGVLLREELMKRSLSYELSNCTK